MKLLKRLWVWIERLAAFAAILVFVTVLVAWFAARTGVLNGMLNRQLDSWLSDRPVTVRLEAVRVHPFTASLEARGIRVLERGVDDTAPLASLDRVTVTLADLVRAIRWNAPAALEVEVTGGSLLFSPRGEQLLSEAFSDRESAGPIDEPSDIPFDLRRLPTLSVRDFELDGLASFGWRGFVSTRFDPGAARFQGSLRLESESRTIGDLVWDGSVDDYGRIHARARGREWNLAGLGDRLDGLLGEGWLASGRASAEAVALYDPSREFPLLALAQLDAQALALGLPAEHSESPAGLGIEAQSARVRARFEPRRPGHWLDPSAFKIHGEVSGRARGTTGPPELPDFDLPIDLEVQLFEAAPAGRFGVARMTLPEVPVGPALHVRAIALCQRFGFDALVPQIEDIILALEPSGEGSAQIHVELPTLNAPAPANIHRSTPDNEPRTRLGAPRVLIAFDPSGTTGITYNGFRDAMGVRHGFPLAAQGARGRFTVAVNPERDVTFQMGLTDLSVNTELGTVSAEGTLARRPPQRRAVKAGIDIDLMLQTERLRIGPQLPAAIRGLNANYDLEDSAQLGDGVAAARVQIRDNRSEPGGRISVDVDFEKLSGAADLAPLPFRDASGEVMLRWTARSVRLDEKRTRRGFGVALHSTAELESAPGVPLDFSAAIRFTDPDEPRPPGTRPTFAMGIEWRDFDLEPNWLRQLQEAMPDLAEPAKIRGLIDLEGLGNFRYSQIRPAQGEPLTERVGVEVQSGTATWPDPAVTLTELGGRLLVKQVRDAAGDPEQPVQPLRIRADLRAAGPDGSRIQAELQPGDQPTIVAWVSGLDLSGELIAAAGTSVDTVRGRVDARIDQALGDKLAPTGVPSVEARLRNNALHIERPGRDPFVLRVLKGRVEATQNGVSAALIEARHVRTPLVVRHFEFARDPATGAANFEGQLWLEDLPLDRAHLEDLFDPEELASWLERLRWRGTLDVRGARFETRMRQGRPTEFELSGELVPHDVFLVLGLPLQLSSARVEIVRLIASGSTGVRAFAEVSELYGTVSGRALTGLQSIVTYTAGKLSLSDLSGDFAGGQVRGLGRSNSGSSALALETAAPHRFEVALHFERVLVSELLEGLFPSGGGADLGDLELDLFLEGRRGDLLGLTGRGRLEILGARLYSLPVVRELFALLGFDSTATFDGMSTSFQLADGVIDLVDAQASSPLVQLGGGGTMDFNGALNQEYTLTYSLVDRLGPFSRLLYWFQDRLVRVSISGDMGRPQVSLSNILFNLFRRNESMRLPLPPRQPLPNRF